jgi:hypothetical protein
VEGDAGEATTSTPPPLPEATAFRTVSPVMVTLKRLSIWDGTRA